MQFFYIEENIKKRPTNERQKKEPAHVSGHVSTCLVASNEVSCTHRLSTDLYNALQSGRWNRSEAPDLKINRIKSDLQLKRKRHGNCCKHKAVLNTWQKNKTVGYCLQNSLIQTLQYYWFCRILESMWCKDGLSMSMTLCYSRIKPEIWKLKYTQASEALSA